MAIIWIWEEREKIRKELKDKGYTNKFINYQEFLELYDLNKGLMVEKEFAEILGITYDGYLNIKNKGQRTKILKEENISHHNLEISFNIYEEGGLFGSKNLDYSMFEADFGIIVDSSSAPGYTILAEAISNMKLLRIDEETTANIGFIGGGGPTNIVTDEVEIKAEARSLDNDKLKAQTDHMVQCVKDAQAKYGIEAEIEVEEAYKAFRVTEDSIPAQAVKAACERAGLEFVPGKSGGGSDANNFNQNGIPSVNIGVGYKNAHTTEEFIPISALHDMTKLLLEIAKA